MKNPDLNGKVEEQRAWPPRKSEKSLALEKLISRELGDELLDVSDFTNKEVFDFLVFYIFKFL